MCNNMFSGPPTAFNQPIGSWDTNVRLVRLCPGCLQNAYAFNQPHRHLEPESR